VTGKPERAPLASYFFLAPFVDLHLLFREGSVSDLSPESTPRNAGASASLDPKGRLRPSRCLISPGELN
jgi:hypothetical protein